MTSYVGYTGPDDPKLRGTLLPTPRRRASRHEDIAGYISRFGYANGRFPRDADELNRYFQKMGRPIPEITTDHFRETMTILENMAAEKNQEAYKKKRESVGTERRKEELSTFKSVRGELMSDKAMKYGEDETLTFREIPEAEQAKIIREEAKNRMRQKEEGGLLPSTPQEPAPVKRPEDRPSGGGMITVTGEQRPGDPYRKGTRAIVTPDGTQIIAEKLENGKYSIKTKKAIPGVPGKWQRLPGEVPEEEIFRRFPEDEIAVKEKPKYKDEFDYSPPPGPGYENPDYYSMGEPPAEPRGKSSLAPPGLGEPYIPGYPGIDEDYIDPYAGYIPDERDRTGPGLAPFGFEDWLRSLFR